tara:strand:- start:1184 stop:1513 length:330 start_codon:yes stop_codon:yes gene_type:complete
MVGQEIPRDKKLHFGAGVLSSAVGYQYVYNQTQDKEKALAAGILTSIIMGVGKEVYDSFQPKNRFDQSDVAATVLGGVTFSFTVKINLINIGGEAKRKKKWKSISIGPG